MKYRVEEIEGEIFHIYMHDQNDDQILNEAKTKGEPLTGTYSAIKHPPHNPTGEYHLHVYDSSNEIFAINKSGKGHDGYSGTRIPNRVFAALQAKYPDYTIPSDQIIESVGHVTVFDFRNEILRPVQVLRYKKDPTTIVDTYQGFFHRFGDKPFLTGGTGGYFAETVAIVEDMDGNIEMVPVDRIRFLDSKEVRL